MVRPGVGSVILSCCVAILLTAHRSKSASVSFDEPRSLLMESESRRHSGVESLKVVTEAETELKRILDHVIPLMAILNRPKRNKQTTFLDKRQYYAKKYEIVNRINNLEKAVNLTQSGGMVRRNDSYISPWETHRIADEKTTEEGSGNQEEEVHFPLNIHFHVGRNRVSEKFESKNENSSHAVLNNNNNMDAFNASSQGDKVHVNVQQQPVSTKKADTGQDFSYYENDEWEETSKEIDDRVIGLRPPPSPYAKNVSDINKILELGATHNRNISPDRIHSSSSSRQYQTVIANQTSRNRSEVTPPHAEIFKAPSLLPRIPLSQRRESQRNDRPYDTAPANVDYRETSSQPPGRGNEYSAGYYYPNTEHYVCCQRQTALGILSFITLALLVAYLIVIVTTTTLSSGRKKRSESNQIEEDYSERDLDAPTWISFVSGIWDASDFEDDALADACTLRALCQMNRIAFFSASPAARMIAFSSLPISYLLHERHDGSGFTRYVNASLAGYNGFNCTNVFHSCPFQIL